MAFLLRLLFSTVMLLVVLVALGLVVYVVAWVINRGVQLVAEYLGYEVGDFFSWLRSKLPKRKRKR